MKKILAVLFIGTLFGLSGCSPEVGTEAWCDQMKEKPKGEWSANEAGDFAKHCVFR